MHEDLTPYTLIKAVHLAGGEMLSDHSPARESEAAVDMAVAFRDNLPRVLADEDQPRLLFQPIVDMQRGLIVGYEALSRFSGPPVAPPDQWFGAAASAGLSLELELRVLRRAIEARRTLPPNCFLSVNLTPELLAAPEVIEEIANSGDASSLVLEITEHAEVADYQRLSDAVARLRALGCRLAVDDAGAGYASLQHILALRPDFVKLDRSLIADIDRDEAKLAVVEMLGAFAGRIDAWVLAEGVERTGELDALARLEVPLAQGYLFGRPADGWLPLSHELSARMRTRAEASQMLDRVLPLLEEWPALSASAPAEEIREILADASTPMLPVLDLYGRPVGLIDREAARNGVSIPRPALTVKTTSEVGDVALRALTRPEASRFDPLVCCDDRGVYLGVVRMERIMVALASRSTKAASAGHSLHSLERKAG